MTKQPILAEGKTKQLRALRHHHGYGAFLSKENVTAGDGKVNEIMVGKAALSNATTCNIFRALKLASTEDFEIPLAYRRRHGDFFVAQVVEMIPVEVVVRNEAAGSHYKRHPDTPKNFVFSRPLVEFYYKTTGQMLFGHDIGCDDPLMMWNDDGTRLAFHHPQKPIDHERQLLEITYAMMTVEERRALYRQLQEAKALALTVSEVLSYLWKTAGGRLVDFKIECGRLPSGKVHIADVIDCDSWRVWWNGMQLSKQPFREGMPVDELLYIYQLTNDIVRHFPTLVSLFWDDKAKAAKLEEERAAEAMRKRQEPATAETGIEE